MIDKNSVLILSGFLFLIGFIGLLRQSKIIKTIISIEIMTSASILNFCFFERAREFGIAHMAAIIAIILSGLVLTIVLSIIVMQFKEGETIDILKEDKL